MLARAGSDSAKVTDLFPRPSLVRITDLHPTQMTLGFSEVVYKRLRWHVTFEKAGRERASVPVAPVVRGPQGRLYLLDRHHLVRAASEEGVVEIFVRPIADLTRLKPDDFWLELDARGWCHPFDTKGRRRPYGDIPFGIDSLVDDPFRSLASALRRAGGFSKLRTPFSEFAWADFLRAHIPIRAVTVDFEGALEHALELARSPAARRLQGWKSEAELIRNERAPLAPQNACC